MTTHTFLLSYANHQRVAMPKGAEIVGLYQFDPDRRIVFPLRLVVKLPEVWEREIRTFHVWRVGKKRDSDSFFRTMGHSAHTTFIWWGDVRQMHPGFIAMWALYEEKLI